MTVNILGTDYEIEFKAYEEDEAFDRCGYAGYCDDINKKIVLCRMETYRGWEHEDEHTCAVCLKSNLRHEIVHAFLSESGLSDNAFIPDEAWTHNEEMIDWIANQGPKLIKAWTEAGAI